MTSNYINKKVPISRRWLDEFERFEHFYKEEVEQLHIISIFIDPSNTIYNIHHQHKTIQNQMITQEELVYIIKQSINKAEETTKWKHKLRELLTFNFTIEPDEVLERFHTDELYLSDSETINTNKNENETFQYYRNYLKNHYSINNITWEPTISLFQDVNTLYIIIQAQDTILSNNRRETISKTNTQTQTQTQTHQNINTDECQKHKPNHSNKSQQTRKIKLLTKLSSSKKRNTKKRSHVIRKS